ncbi:MAG: cytochrome c-type biogenesis protein CcmH [Actinobacteria bacterium]|nr:cytochrome c-type biogenesis protein CcmH [Actinomycetota bacterium]
MRRWLAWVVLPAVLVGALVIGTRGDGAPPTDAERTAALASELRCPTCRGQSVLDSDAPAATAIRSEIARRVQEGQSDEEIFSYIDGRFSDSLRLTPPRTGVASLVWVLPVAGLVVAGAALALTFRRWRADSAPHVTDDDRRLVQRALREPDA